jgi:tetratricopeptide (TPR) repeat protein
VGSTGRLALLIVLLASTCCSSGVRREQTAQKNEQKNEQKVEKVVANPPAPSTPKPQPPKVRVVSEDELAQAQKDYQVGVEAFEWGRYSDAAEYFEKAYRIKPNMNELQQYLERSYIALGMERYTAGQPEEAIAVWKKVLRIDPSDEKAQTYIARTKEEIARLPADQAR